MRALLLLPVFAATFAQAADYTEDFQSEDPSIPLEFLILDNDYPPTYVTEDDNRFLRLASLDNMGTNNLVLLNVLPSDFVVDYLRLSFDFRVGAVDGADGMGILLWNPSHTFDYIEAEEPSVESSLGIGLDTWANGAEYDFDSDNHVSLHWDEILVDTYDPGFLFEDGTWHRAELVLDFAADQLTFALDGTTLIDEGLSTFSGLNPSALNVLIGARTGSVTNDHDIDNIELHFTGASIPEPRAYVLAAGVAALVFGVIRRFRRAC